MPLSDTTCKNTKPKEKSFKLADEKGMFLLINPNGSKYFRFKYRFDGKEKVLALGVYPDTSLKQARIKRDQAREQIANGIDPNENKKAVKLARSESLANSFEVIALEWYQKNIITKSDHHQKRITSLFNRDLFPYIGAKPISEIKPTDLLGALRRIEARNAIETAHRAMQVSSQVFRYAVATGRTDRDITPDLRGALTKADEGHFAAVTDPKKAAELLRAIDGYAGSFVVKTALQLAPLLFQRPGELRQAEWQQIDFEAKEWRYFVNKTKVEHIVPLSKQAIDLLTDLHPLTGKGRYIFPSARTPNGSRAMSDAALLGALRRMGFEKSEMTIHGFRAMARTILDEVLGHRVDFIEHQLAHAVKDPNGRAYNRTAHLPARHKMMQAWADYLDGLKNGAQVIAFRKAAN